jgi:hypothetical protein
MTAVEHDTLQRLDWQPRCQGGCPNTAVYEVHLHCVDDCGGPHVNEDGDRVEIRCESCLTRMRAGIVTRLARVARYGVAHCQTCGSPVCSLPDVMREVHQLGVRK